jgi:hypothetical protein
MTDLLNKLQIALEWPAGKRLAGKRGFPADAAILEVHERDERGVHLSQLVGDMAQLIELWQDGTQQIFATPYLSYMSDRDWDAFLAEWQVLGEATAAGKDDYVLQCPTRAAVTKLLESCRAESIVIMYASNMQDAVETTQHASKWVRARKSFEAGFLERQSVHGGFVFYDKSHRGIEVVGDFEFVLTRCLRRLLQC